MASGGSAWRVLAAGLGALLVVSAQGRAEVYPIDQRVTSIGFEVSGLGLLSERGAFSRFHGVLSLDTVHPEATTIAVTIAADSAAMGWGVATAALLSPTFFDAAGHPLMRFSSRRVERIGPALYRITGTLDIRGIVRPLRVRAPGSWRYHAGPRGFRGHRRDQPVELRHGGGLAAGL